MGLVNLFLPKGVNKYSYPCNLYTVFSVLQAVNMNAKTHTFSFKIECHNVFEVVSSLFHSILFLRSHGKLQRTPDGHKESPQHFEDVDLGFIELTYVRNQSTELQRCVDESIKKFSTELHRCSEPRKGTISLEFYRIDKRIATSFLPRHVVWEAWTINIEIIHLMSVRTITLNNIRLFDQITEAIFYINEIVNQSSYVPKLTDMDQTNLIFDMSFSDVQPYLFKVSHETKLTEFPLLKAVSRFFNNFF